jgi:hypothetical protein
MGSTDQLSVEHVPLAPSREEKLRQVERILASQAFLNAHRLQKFLQYIATKTIEGQEDEVKEYTVGLQVFRKGSDFDPRTDTQVRTEASRLRLRLERYYATEGASDDLLVEIPRGHYVPQFAPRVIPKPEDSESDARNVPPRAVEASAAGARVDARIRRLAKFRTGVLVGLAAVAVGLVAVAAFWAGRSAGAQRPQPSSRGADASPEGGLVAALWSGLIEAGNPPIVAFSNPAFLINGQRELLPYTEQGTLPLGTLIPQSSVRKRPGSAGLINSGHIQSGGPLSFYDALTGSGEVSAVLSLDRVLRRLGSPAEVKRGRLITTDDLHRRNVVFVGSPDVNGVLGNLRLSGEFAFVEDPADPAPLWKTHIVNLHPQPGEKQSYEVERDPVTGALLAEHALVSFLPGISPRRTIVMLAGVGTGGTQAAADFSTSPAGVAELTSHLGHADPKLGKQVSPFFFQVLIRVEYARGMSLGIHYVTGRTIQPQRSAFLAGASGSNADDELK